MKRSFLLPLVLLFSMWSVEHALSDERPQLQDRVPIQSHTQGAKCTSTNKFTLTNPRSIDPLNSQGQLKEEFPFRQENLFSSWKSSRVESLLNLKKDRKLEGNNPMGLSYGIPILNDCLTVSLDRILTDYSNEIKMGGSSEGILALQFSPKGTIDRPNNNAKSAFWGKESLRQSISTPQDRSGGNVFWEWDFHNLKPRAEISRRIDKPNGKNLRRPRTIRTIERISVDWGQPKWPLITLGYTHELKEPESKSLRLPTSSISKDKINAKISHWNTSLETFVNSHSVGSGGPLTDNIQMLKIGSLLSGRFKAFGPIQFIPKLGLNRASKPLQQLLTDQYFAKLGSSIRIAQSLTLKPGFEYTQLVNRLNSRQTETIFAKLGSSYIEKERTLSMSMFGGFKIRQDSQDSINLHTYDFVFSVQKGLYRWLKLPHRTQSLSLNLTHNQRINYLSRNASSAQTSAVLMLNIIP